MIEIMQVLEFIDARADDYAKAKAERFQVEEYRKTLKALLMKKAEGKGVTAANAQEREAYADQEYSEHVKAIAAAVEIEEALRWKLISAQAKIEVWRSQEATSRAMVKGAA